MSENYDWKKLPVILKRFKLDDKLGWCSYYASSVCPDWRYDMERSKGEPHPFPWELDIIAMLAIAGTEYDTQVVTKNIFHKFINTVRTAIPFSRGDDFESVVLHFLMRPQLLYQTDVRIFLTRYFYMFTHSDVHLDLVVEKKLGVPYCNLLGLTVMAWALGVNNQSISVLLANLYRNKNIIVADKMRCAISALSLDRETFVAQQNDKINLSKRGYILADNILEQFPFLRLGDTFILPLPYLLKNAVSIGLLHRIASGENVGLRAEIGKKILEEYVCEIMKYSGCYDFVSREIKYRRNGRDSPDVIASKNDVCVFMEVKFKEPILKLRTLDPHDEERLDTMCAQAIAQVYKGMVERKEYIKERIFSDDNVFGIVVLFEEPNLSRARIFAALAKEHPEWDGATIAYIKRHIRVVSLYDIEVICFRHHDVIGVLQQYCAGSEKDLFNLTFFSMDDASGVKNLDIFSLQKMLDYATQGFSEMIIDKHIEKFLGQ